MRDLTDMALTSRVKRFAREELNADLVGVADIGRFQGAPLRMSPQGILPSARSVVVMAVHHPDAAIELGGEKHPQKIGPYCVQYVMNMRLDEMSTRMGRFLESLGYTAVPIVSSNIWRYKGYKELKEHFAPDMSHLHAAVAAGLAEFGYSGLSITPEFGARQRYVSVITDAALAPSPLVEPGTVCDNCMLCKMACPTAALSKELDGWNEVTIEGRMYRYARKNLWRCAWGEHFDLDLDLAIPEKVDEAVILDHVKRFGRRSGEMGCCLKACVPKARRYFDKAYCKSPRRTRDAVPQPGLVSRGLFERLRALIQAHGVSCILTVSAEELRASGVKLEDSKAYLPGVKCAVIVCLAADRDVVRETADVDKELALEITLVAGGLRETAEKLTMQTGYDLSRELERAGYSATGGTEVKESEVAQAVTGVPAGLTLFTYTVLTDAELPSTGLTFCEPSAERVCDFTEALKAEAKRLGADVCGVTSMARLRGVAKQARLAFEGDEVLDAQDKSQLFTPYEPQISSRTRQVSDPAALLPNGKAVLVFGVALPRGSVEVTARTPAEAVGPYAFALYENLNDLRRIALRLTLWLSRQGVKAAVSTDLLDTGSKTASPRGAIPDLFSNRFEAWAAGLGRFAKAGFLVNPRFGTNVRYMAVVVDRELREDALQRGAAPEKCAACGDRCLAACATQAFCGQMTVEADGIRDTFHTINTLRCDWAKRYSLIADEGCGFVGWKLNVPPPAKVTAEALAAALRQQPPIPKYRPCNFEACSMACPYTRSQKSEVRSQELEHA
jgi:epoxyqueuosine reductase QueG